MADPASLSTNVPVGRRRLWRWLALGCVVVLLLASAGVWSLVVRPRQLVEVRDKSGRISVQVPRSWSGTIDHGWSYDNHVAVAELTIGQDRPRVRLFNILGTGSLEPNKQCGATPTQTDNQTDTGIQIWAARNCPAGWTTLWWTRQFENEDDQVFTLMAEITTDDEALGRKILDSIRYERRTGN